MRPNPRSVIALGLAGFICITGACANRQDENSPTVIELELIVELQDSPGEIEFSMGGSFSSYILRDRHGRFYVHPYGGHRIAVFDSTGVYLHSIGRAGHGPGELGRSPMAALYDADDRIWVWEFMSRKATIYDPDGVFIETVRLPFRPEFQLKDGSLLGIEYPTQPRGYSGYPLHRLSVAGELLSSFGSTDSDYSVEQRYLYEMIAALTSDGLLWMTPSGRYRLELWDPLTERQLMTLPIKVPWFKETIGSYGDYMEVEPTDVINFLSVDKSGVIWVVIQTADDDWKPARIPEVSGEVSLSADERSIYFDWVVHAIHPETGKVLAERRFQQAIWMLRGSTGLVTAKEDQETGSVSYYIWRPVLVQSIGVVDN